MKKLKLKRTGTWLILAVFLFSAVMSMTGVTLESKAATNDLIIDSWSSDPSTISPNSNFTLKLQLKNISASNISNISIDFSNNSNVLIQNKGSVYQPNVTLSPNQTSVEIPINMTYTGTGSVTRVELDFEYTIGSTTGSSVEYINLNVQDSSSSTPSDTTKFKPSLQTSISGSNTVNAGSTSNVNINIKNISTSVGAQNVVFVPVYDKNSPFEASRAVSSMPIKIVQVGTSTDASISIDVDKYADEGTYPFAFKLTYYNAWNDEFTTDYTVYLKVKTNQSPCSLNLQIPENQSVKAAAGSTFTLPLILKNDGSMYAKDIKVTLTGLSQDAFMLSSGTGRVDVGRIDGYDEYSLNYTIKASSSMKTASYPLTFKIEYVDEKGTKVSDEQQVWIPVAGNEDKVSMLEILEITPSKTSVKPSESFDVTVKVRNSGDFESRQIKVSADGTASLMPVSQNLYIIPTLKKGETKTIIFKFQPQPDAARGGVPITIKVDSVDGGQTSSIAQAISVFVDSTNDGKTEAGKNVPKIIVKSYSSEPTLVKAGEKFTLHLEFLNTHADKTVKNIKGNFIVTEGSNETGNVFTPVDCSNTFYIDQIDPKGTYDWDLTLYTIPDAKSKTYTVTISFEYEDDMGNPYKADELIGIPVYQPARFETSEINMPPQAFMGQPVFVSFEMYNMGKNDIYNVKLNVEGDFDAQPKSNYFGNFESGRREYFELNLIPTMVGDAKGRIVFQYETASGEKQEVVKEFSMNVSEMSMPVGGDMPIDGKPMPGDMGGEPQAKSGGFIGSVWFFVIIGVVVVGVIVTIVLVRRKRKKDKEFDF